MKSSGNLSILRRTCSFNRLVSTPYKAAKSESKSTVSPLTSIIVFNIYFSGIRSPDFFAIYYVLKFEVERCDQEQPRLPLTSEVFADLLTDTISQARPAVAVA